MWLLDHKESWGLKNWCFWTVVVEKILESPLAYKETKPVNPKGNQSWLFTRRTDAEAETPVLCPPDAKNWLTGKDPDAGKEWRPEEKGTTEYDMVGWHRWFDGLEFQQALGVGDGQGSLVCCSPWCCTESDTTEPLKWTDCNRENALNTSSLHVSKWNRKWHFLTWKYKQGEQQLCVCERDGARGGDGWTDSMMEKFNRKCFFL